MKYKPRLRKAVEVLSKMLGDADLQPLFALNVLGGFYWKREDWGAVEGIEKRTYEGTRKKGRSSRRPCRRLGGRCK